MNAIAGDPAQARALALLAVAVVLLAVSGLPGLLLRRRSPWGPRLAATLVVAGALAGIAGGCLAIAAPGESRVGLASSVPGLAPSLGSDALSGFFALPIFLVGALGSLYGLSYWPPREKPRNGRRLRLCYGLLLASLAAIVLARDGISFLVAWEVMALSNFLLVTTEEQDAAVRRAGWLYLLYSHVTVLCLFALFVLAGPDAGGLALAVVPAAAAPGLRTAIFVLALVAFGAKAGVMPLHSWLPAAHASAPSHVSAVMSGVVIKVGVYGLVRVCGLLEEPPLAWALTLLAVGALSAFFGVAFALGQHDVKRLLAYHSIENVGIIVLGLGLAMAGRSLGRADWVLLGIGGCLLHVWNHALFKSLLFFGAGSVVHATGTRELDAAGGLARRMPWTAGFFLLGSIAICALPPLNGFVSELLVYLGLVRAAAAPGGAWAALAVPLLAATGGLAVACFVKVYGVVFLGTPRSAAARDAHEAPASMRAPMAVLGLACLAIGVAPGMVAPALERAAAAWLRQPLPAGALAAVAPFGWISAAAAALLAGVAVLGLLVAPVCRRARRRQPHLPTWDCGYAASSPRLQYTASSFAQPITSRFAWALRPTVQRPQVEGPFPAPSRFQSHGDDSILAGLLLPAARGMLRTAAALRTLPGGQLQRYILYLLAVLVPLLAWALAGGHAR